MGDCDMCEYHQAKIDEAKESGVDEWIREREHEYSAHLLQEHGM